MWNRLWVAFGKRRLRAPKDYADMSAQRGTVAGAGSSDWVPVIVHDVTIAMTIINTITNSTTIGPLLGVEPLVEFIDTLVQLVRRLLRRRG